jgi:hypothetical protein
MKVVAEIACEYPEIGEHLNKKAHKIASIFLLTSRPDQDEQKVFEPFVRRNQVRVD